MILAKIWQLRDYNDFNISGYTIYYNESQNNKADDCVVQGMQLASCRIDKSHVTKTYVYSS